MGACTNKQPNTRHHCVSAAWLRKHSYRGRGCNFYITNYSQIRCNYLRLNCCSLFFSDQSCTIPHLDVAAFDLEGVSLQRSVVVHEGPKQRHSPDFPIRGPTLEYETCRCIHRSTNGETRKKNMHRLL